MARLYHHPRGYSNQRGFSIPKIIGLIVLLAITLTALYFMRYLEELSMPSRIIIGVMAGISLMYFVWMIDGLTKKN